MVSISRGRGRGWALNDNNSLPKPGGSLYADDTVYTNLLNLINLVNNENLTQIIEDIAILLNKNKEKIKELFKKLHSYALDNTDFVIKLILVCDDSIIRDICDTRGRTLHSCLVKQQEEDHERRRDLKQENAAQYYKRIMMFSKYLCYIYYSSDRMFRTSYEELVDCLAILLETPSPDDIQFFTERLIVHGQVLTDICTDKLKDLMVIVRQVLLKENLPLTSRQFLLYAIDLDNKDFEQLPPSLLEFYTTKCGENFIEKDKYITDFLKNMNLIEYVNYHIPSTKRRMARKRNRNTRTYFW